jgi:antitoxin CptB
MRELDLLLEKFLASHLGSLEDDDLDRLEKLLEQPDQDILAWLTATMMPEGTQFSRIIGILRNHVQPRQHADE